MRGCRAALLFRLFLSSHRMRIISLVTKFLFWTGKKYKIYKSFAVFLAVRLKGDKVLENIEADKKFLTLR